MTSSHVTTNKTKWKRAPASALSPISSAPGWRVGCPPCHFTKATCKCNATVAHHWHTHTSSSSVDMSLILNAASWPRPTVDGEADCWRKGTVLATMRVWCPHKNDPSPTQMVCYCRDNPWMLDDCTTAANTALLLLTCWLAGWLP